MPALGTAAATRFATGDRAGALALGRTSEAGVRLRESRDLAGALEARPLVAEADALVSEAAASS